MAETVVQSKEEKKARKREKQAQRLDKAKAGWLNRYFHHIDSGSTLGREIAAGIVVCILSVCGIFMNLQLVSALLVSGPSASASVADIAANGEIICRMYFFAMMTAFVGSLVMGLVARQPLTQIPSMGMTVVLISTLGIGSGLTWQNLLALCFVSALVYLAIAVIPPVSRAVVDAIPAGVRRAAPAVTGLLLAFVCLQLTGIVQMGNTSIAVQGVNSAAINLKKFSSTLNENVAGFAAFDFAGLKALAYKGDSFHPWILCAMGGAVTAMVVYLLVSKTKHPVLYALLAGTVGFFLGYLSQIVFYVGKNGKVNFELDSLWGRLWMVGSEDAQHLHLSYLLNNMDLGKVFKEGFDFTAFTEAGGNVAALFATAILTFLFMNLNFLETAVAENGKKMQLAMVCNAGINVLAPVVGSAPVSVTPLNGAGKRDGGRSGIAAVAASIGFLISAFVWLIPFLFCTTTNYDITFNLYGHYGTVIQMMTENTSFLVVDGVMVLVGLYLIAGSVKGGFAAEGELTVYLATVLCGFLLMNPAFGMAMGTAAHLLVSLFDRERKLTVGNVAAAVLSIGLVILTLA